MMRIRRVQLDLAERQRLPAAVQQADCAEFRLQFFAEP